MASAIHENTPQDSIPHPLHPVTQSEIGYREEPSMGFEEVVGIPYQQKRQTEKCGSGVQPLY